MIIHYGRTNLIVFLFIFEKSYFLGFSAVVRGGQRLSEALRGCQRLSEALRASQSLSEALRGSQKLSGPLRASQSLSEPLSGFGTVGPRPQTSYRQNLPDPSGTSSNHHSLVRHVLSCRKKPTRAARHGVRHGVRHDSNGQATARQQQTTTTTTTTPHSQTTPCSHHAQGLR